MKHPVKVYLKKGKIYHFCTCGKSADGVLCDESHKGTEFRPKAFIATRNSEMLLCLCKKIDKSDEIISYFKKNLL